MMEVITTVRHLADVNGDPILAKIWCKHVTAIDPDKHSGYALIGDFVSGREINNRLMGSEALQSVSFQDFRRNNVYVIGVTLVLPQSPSGFLPVFPVDKVAFVFIPTNNPPKGQTAMIQRAYAGFGVGLAFRMSNRQIAAGIAAQNVHFEYPWNVTTFDNEAGDNPFFIAAMEIRNSYAVPDMPGLGGVDNVSKLGKALGDAANKAVEEMATFGEMIGRSMDLSIPEVTKPKGPTNKIRYGGKTYRLPEGWTFANRMGDLILLRHPQGHVVLMHELIEVDNLSNEVYGLIDEQAKVLETLAAMYRIVGAPGRALREDKEKRKKERKDGKNKT